MTFSSLLAGCETTTVLAPVKPPPERMDCVYIAVRPALPPEYVIDWSRVLTVPQARTEHETYVRSVRTREGVVAGYIIDIEGRYFACSNDDEWLRDFYSKLPDG